jgi:hypothetical protein
VQIYHSGTGLSVYQGFISKAITDIEEICCCELSTLSGRENLVLVRIEISGAHGLEYSPYLVCGAVQFGVCVLSFLFKLLLRSSE